MKKQLMSLLALLCLICTFVRADGPQQSVVANSSANVYPYPNPWRGNQDASHPMTFANLPSGSHVAIYTISGELVVSLPQGTNTWDINNSKGEHVASGVYLYLVFPQDITGKLAVIR